MQLPSGTRILAAFLFLLLATEYLSVYKNHEKFGNPSEIISNSRLLVTALGWGFGRPFYGGRLYVFRKPWKFGMKRPFGHYGGIGYGGMGYGGYYGRKKRR